MPFDEPPDFKRGRWDRPLVKPADGGKPVSYTRCTTFVDALEEKYALSQWQQRMVAVGVSQRKDLLLAIASLAPQLMLPSEEVPSDVKDKANRICEKALEAAQATSGATTGTALHRMAQTLDSGRALGEIPDAARRDLDAYARATAPLTSLYVEHPMVLDDLQIGGTPDRIVELGGVTYIADIKTGRIDFGALKIGMQLAVYAHSLIYDPRDEKRLPTPRIDQHRAIVIHLPAGKGVCTLQWVDIGRAWAAVDVARQVRDWRRASGWMSDMDVDEPLPLPGLNAGGGPEAAQEAAHRLAELVGRAASADELTALWATNRDVWDESLTELAVARKAQIGAVA